MNKLYLVLLFIIFLASLLRLILLNNVPNAISYDQLYYILNAKSFLYTGTDLSGSITPFHLLLFQYPTDGLTQAELPFFLQFPLLSFLPMSLQTIVLPNAIISILIVGIMFLIGAKLFDKKTALFISLIAAINPWFIFIGRTFYEVVPATFFYLCGFYILLIARGWKILFAFPLFLLAFYSYIGTKLIFFPFILLAVLYCYFVLHKRKYAKQYLVLLILSLLTSFFLFFQLQQQPESSRLSEIIFPNHPVITEQVDTLRKLSINNPLTNILINKITVYLQIVSINFLHVFTPTYLFAYGDNFFSMYRHGLFYLVDAVFLIVGALWLFVQKRKLFVFFLLAIILSTLPQIIHDPEAGGNFTPHIALLFPFFIIIIGFGISKITEITNKITKMILFTLTGIIYLVSLANFLNIYFYQFPLQTGIFDFSPRVLAQYIAFAKKDQQEIKVYSASSEIAFKKYLFYSNAYTKESAASINNAINEKNYSLKQITFLPCPDKIDPANKTDLMIVDAICGETIAQNFISIAQLTDSGKTYNIINDTICKKYALQPFISQISLAHLNPEKLDEKAFCEKLIIH